MDTIVWSLLLAALVLAVFSAVVIRTLLAATVLLALSSVLVAIILFVSGMKLAAVIELSVGVGLVTAILASAIAMLKSSEDESQDAAEKKGKGRAKRLVRYLPLPIIMLLVAALILNFVPGMDINSAQSLSSDASVQTILWNNRALDIIGLTLLILAGVLGVAELIRRREEK